MSHGAHKSSGTHAGKTLHSSSHGTHPTSKAHHPATKKSAVAKKAHSPSKKSNKDSSSLSKNTSAPFEKKKRARKPSESDILTSQHVTCTEHYHGKGCAHDKIHGTAEPGVFHTLRSGKRVLQGADELLEVDDFEHKYPVMQNAVDAYAAAGVDPQTLGPSPVIDCDIPHTEDEKAVLLHEGGVVDSPEGERQDYNITLEIARRRNRQKQRKLSSRYVPPPLFTLPIARRWRMMNYGLSYVIGPSRMCEAM